MNVRGQAVYDPRTRGLHWLTAAFVILLWTLGQTIDFFATGSPRVAARSVHITLGVVLAVIVAYRLWWRRSPQRTVPPPLEDRLGRIGTRTHQALYVLVAAVVVLGFFNEWVRGDSIFGLFRIPALDPGNKPLRELAGEVHGWGANVLLIVAAVHALAGLYHHIVLRDDVLRRMLPQRHPAAESRPSAP